MSLTAAVLDALLEAGATAEMIVAAVKADLRDVDAAVEARRAKDAERQRRRRAGVVTPCHAESRGHDVTDSDPSPSLSPPDPPNHTPIRKEISTRARGGFAEFWLAYPRKEGKGAAEKAYAKALTLIRGHDPPALLLAALERVKATWTDAQFIPHASTWLNQRRWEDEPEPRHERRNHPQRPERITSLAGIIARDRGQLHDRGDAERLAAGGEPLWGHDG